MNGAAFSSVSFVIPTLNEQKHLLCLLQSIESLEVPDGLNVVETIVVDADSTDETVAIAKARGCHVIAAERGSVARSRNLGAAEARGEILAFIDADCELPSRWLAAAIESLRDDVVVAVGSGMAIPGENSSWVERAWHEVAHKQDTVAPVTQVRWLASFNLACKRERFQQVGGFDELLPTCEDVDFGYRIGQSGKLLRINGHPVVHHGESKTLGEFFRRESWRARGAVRGLALHWRDLRETLSFMLPLVVTGGMVVGALLLLFGQWSEIADRWPWFLTGLGLLLLPVFLLVIRRRPSIRLFVACYILLVVYFVARSIGVIRPFPRVERST